MKLAIIDLGNIFWRWMLAKQNAAVGAIAKAVADVIAEQAAGWADRVVVCCDPQQGERSWRTLMWDQYKAHREERAPQHWAELGRTIQACVGRWVVLPAVAYPRPAPDGGAVWFEADDTIASVAAWYRARLDTFKDGYRCRIYSGDSDLAALVDEDAGVELCRKTGDRWQVLTEHDLACDAWDKVPVHPRRLADFKALAGESDEVPGFEGIGAKRATVLLEGDPKLPERAGFDTVLNLVDMVAKDETTPPWLLKYPKVLESLRAGGRPLAELGLRLATLRTDVPLPPLDAWLDLAPAPPQRDPIAEARRRIEATATSIEAVEAITAIRRLELGEAERDGLLALAAARFEALSAEEDSHVQAAEHHHGGGGRGQPEAGPAVEPPRLPALQGGAGGGAVALPAAPVTSGAEKDGGQGGKEQAAGDRAGKEEREQGATEGRRGQEQVREAPQGGRQHEPRRDADHDSGAAVARMGGEHLASRALAMVNPSSPEWALALQPIDAADAYQMAKAIHESGLFPKFKSPQAVWTIMLAGREHGLSALASLQSLTLIEGKVELDAALIVALVLRSGLARYFTLRESTDERATWATHRVGEGEQPIAMSFTLAEAERRGLFRTEGGRRVCGRESKLSNWQKMPDVMLMWRAATKLARAKYPDVCRGLYGQGEIREARGEAWEAEVVEMKGAA